MDEQATDLPTLTARREGVASIDDRTPLEAAITDLDRELTQLDQRIREHAEVIAPVLRPEASDDSGMVAAVDERAPSERVSQVRHLAYRVSSASEALRQLTARSEA